MGPAAALPRLLVVMGSGETAPTMAKVMRPAVMALPPGSSPEDMEHAARGALIQLDVFNRVMKTRRSMPSCV